MRRAPEKSVADLVALPKRATKARILYVGDDADARLDVHLEAAGLPRGAVFDVFVRVPLALHERFSFGLRYKPPGLDCTVLVRLNGDHSGHKDKHGGWIDGGPHLHEFKAPRRDAPPAPNAVTKWAWPLPVENLAIPVAWRTFCSRVNLTSTDKIDEQVSTFYLPKGQMQIPGM